MSSDWDTLSREKRLEVLEFTRRVLRNRVVELQEAVARSPIELPNRSEIATLLSSLQRLVE